MNANNLRRDPNLSGYGSQRRVAYRRLRLDFLVNVTRLRENSGRSPAVQLPEYRQNIKHRPVGQSKLSQNAYKELIVRYCTAEFQRIVRYCITDIQRIILHCTTEFQRIIR